MDLEEYDQIADFVFFVLFRYYILPVDHDDIVARAGSDGVDAGDAPDGHQASSRGPRYR
ncbi:Uu.00g032290.m01.CDS01 [Anthostomella pinea]|uniref:Uu.00g032290.m01.CDS01 n=1 Tax=Anthostomella pinea TaxID=933095 RepID=A0AAI8V8N3_9PEZI|nr:Uu.00g032290.m01.CDS01 [Anthostomella pinea]